MDIYSTIYFINRSRSPLWWPKSGTGRVDFWVRWKVWGLGLQAEASLQTLTLDVLKSSEIEGESLDAEQVSSSIARRLGMGIAGLVPADRHVEGIVEMMLDAMDAVIKGPIAHLWFVTIHPFDDGNGRIARAIADMQLARADGTPQRFYSRSAQIRKERKEYYDILETTQKDSLDITQWLLWFLQCLDRAIAATDETLGGVLKKARFWEKHRATLLNDRQRIMMNKLLDGFDGKLNTSKWG